jgi:hypothetical protein
MKRLTLLIGCLIFFCAPLAQSLAQERTLTKAAVITSSLAEPVKITTFSLKTGESRQVQSAQGNINWVNQSVLQVENTSGKAIKYLVIEVSVPGVESLNGRSPLMLAYGQAPGQKSSSKLAEALQPAAKINMSVSRNACDAVKSRLLASGTRPPSGSRVTTRINGVIFTDGTAWFDGLPHVADPNNPLRWNVVEESPSQADLDYAPLFKMANVSYRVKVLPASGRPDKCWKRMGTEWVECCGLTMASAILIQIWGGIYEPFVMSNECEDGSSCEWVKQVLCSTDPEG